MTAIIVRTVAYLLSPLDYAGFDDRVEQVAADALDQRDVLDQQDDLVVHEILPHLQEGLADVTDAETGRPGHGDVEQFVEQSRPPRSALARC